jgi:putative redox protein
MIEVNWKGGMAFQAAGQSGIAFTFDAYPESGGSGLGPTPLEGFLGALAACTAMDVISILEKKRQKVTSYRVEVEGDRTPPGSPFPRPYTALRLRHILTGENLDQDAVARAIELSDEKYCSVSATLRFGPPVTSEWVVEEAGS